MNPPEMQSQSPGPDEPHSRPPAEASLSHFDARGQAWMVDVG